MDARLKDTPVKCHKSLRRRPCDYRLRSSLFRVTSLGKARFKLLQFCSNYRPAYFGPPPKRITKKAMHQLKYGRRMFRIISDHVEYNVGSDEEWEEEEPSDVEEEEGTNGEEDHLDYEDKWLAFENEVEYEDGRNYRIRS